MFEDRESILQVEEDEFEQMMRQRIESNFSGGKKASVMDAKLEEISKKLPAWSLEPPHSFLK